LILLIPLLFFQRTQGGVSTPLPPVVPPAAARGVLVDEYIEIYSDDEQGYDYDNTYDAREVAYGDEPGFGGDYSPSSSSGSSSQNGGGWVEYVT